MTMTEMAKQIKEFNERLDRYYDNQELLESFNGRLDECEEFQRKNRDKLEELTDKVDGLGIVAQETTRQLKEQVDRLNKYRDVQDAQFVTYDRKIKQQNISINNLEAKKIEAGVAFDKLTEAYSNLNGRLGDYKKEKNDKLESIEQRLNSMDDTTAYVRQVAEESKKLEEALKVSTRKLDLFSQKNLELIERNKRLSEQNVKLQEEIKAANKMCDNVSKKASKLADRVQKLEADSSRILRLEDRVWEHEDKLAKASKLDDRIQQLETSILGDKFTEVIKRIENDALRIEENKPLWAEDFSKFNAGKMAIVFDGDDPHFEATYMDFCRSIDEWCCTSEKNDKMYPQSAWTTRGSRMDPLMKCPSIYKDHSSFAIWIGWVDEKVEPTFEYGTLMTDWREHKTVGGLPYTVWKI